MAAVPELVLVVDDNAMNVKLVKFLLTKRGYRVLTALSAGEALAALEAEIPALILMDIQLPGMDGLELTSRLRLNQALADVHIVAVTASAMRGDEERALAVQVRVATTDDALADSGEAFTLTANVIAGTTANASATGTATISDEAVPDTVIVSLAGPAAVVEGTPTSAYTVSLPQNLLPPP